MTESKIEIVERLRRQGIWAEASLWKDQKVKVLRAGGMSGADAKEAAWRLMAAEFPPLAEVRMTPVELGPLPIGAEPTAPMPIGTESNNLDDTLIDFDGDNPPPDLVRDTLWTYENLENRRAKPADAPGSGAWSLLLWARQYRNRFFEQILPKAMMNRPADDEEKLRDDKRKIADIRKLLQQHNEKMEADLRRDLLASVPATIQARVRDRLRQWAEHFRFTIGDDAQESLEASLCGFIADCAKTIGRTPAAGK